MTNNDEPEQLAAPEMLHRELLQTINRCRHEGDLSICEVLGVLRLVEEDVIQVTR